MKRLFSILIVITLSLAITSCQPLLKQDSIKPTNIVTATSAAEQICTEDMKMWIIDNEPFMTSWNQLVETGLDKDNISQLKQMLTDFHHSSVPECGQGVKRLYEIALESDIDVLKAYREHNMSENEFEALVELQGTNYETFRSALGALLEIDITPTPLSSEWPTTDPNTTVEPSVGCEGAAITWTAQAEPLVEQLNALVSEALNGSDTLPEIEQTKLDLEAIEVPECVEKAKSLLLESMEYSLEAGKAIIDHKATEADVYSLLHKSDEIYDEFLIEIKRISNQ